MTAIQPSFRAVVLERVCSSVRAEKQPFLSPARQVVILLGPIIDLFSLPNTVSVPEEHPDVPGGVQRSVWHEEKRAVRVLRPFRRQGLRKGKTGSPGYAVAVSAILCCVYAESAKRALMCFDVQYCAQGFTSS